MSAFPKARVLTPAEMYYELPGVKEAADEMAVILNRDLQILANRINALPDDAVTECPRKIREIVGIKKGIVRQAEQLQRDLGGSARAFMWVFVFDTPRWERFERMRSELYHKSRRYKAWRADYEATPQRKASVKAAQRKHEASPQRAAYEASEDRKAAEALRKRMAYYGVSRPEDLPQKSTRGRKASIAKHAE